MKKTVEIDVCEVCPFKQENIIQLSSTRKCEVCERMLCNSTEHVADTYHSTSHMRSPFTQYVCKNCWEECLYNTGYNPGTSPLPKGDIDLHASGSTSAINIAEFREWVKANAENMANQAVIDVLREIKAGLTKKFDKEKAIRELKAKHAAEIEAVKQEVASSPAFTV